jgi:hypothetical protein
MTLPVTWTQLRAGATGRSAEIGDCPALCAIVTGRFGGARVVLEGSQQGQHFGPVTAFGDGISGDDAPPVIGWPPRHIRPVVIGGDSTTAINVRVVARQPR